MKEVLKLSDKTRLSIRSIKFESSDRPEYGYRGANIITIEYAILDRIKAEGMKAPQYATVESHIIQVNSSFGAERLQDIMYNLKSAARDYILDSRECTQPIYDKENEKRKREVIKEPKQQLELPFPKDE